MVIGFTYIVTYLNLLTMGYSLLDYLSFIFTRIECLFSLVGLLMVSLVIILSGRHHNDLYI